MANAYGQSIATGDRAPNGTKYNQGGNKNSYAGWGGNAIGNLGASGWQDNQTSGGGGFQASGWNDSGWNDSGSGGSAFEKAAAGSQLFQQNQAPVDTKGKATTNTNPSDARAVTNNTVSQFGDVINSLFGASKNAEASQRAGLKDMLGTGLQNGMTADNNRARIASEAAFRQNQNAMSATAAAKTSPLSMTEQTAADNAKLAAQYQKDQADATDRFKSNASANAMLGSAQAAADASKYAAGQSAQAGIFGSLFGSISNAGSGVSRYW